MTPTPEVQERLRRYVLGQLAEDAREEIEKALLTNSEQFEELLILEDELVDDYVAGNLSAIDRTAFEKHFLPTPERTRQLRFGRAFKQYLSSRQPVVPQETKSTGWWSSPRAFFSSPWRAVAFAAAALVIAFGAWQVFLRQSPVDEGLLALNSAFREQRPLESRISSLDYAPYVVTRGPGDDRTNHEELRRAELILLNAQKNATPAMRHALGKVYLAKKDFDEAIEQFNTALKSDPNNAQIYSDLGAAWLEKANISLRVSRNGTSLEALARSLEYLQKAIELKPDFLPALFNRAICHEAMGLLSQAGDDCREYLRFDSTSSWAAEMRQKIKLLQEQDERSRRSKTDLLRDYRAAHGSQNDNEVWKLVSVSRDDLSGANIFQQLVDSYVAHARAGQEDDAARDLTELTYLGELAVRKANDHYEAEVAGLLPSMPSNRFMRFTAARELMKQGYALYGQSRLLEAAAVFQQARQAFGESGDWAHQSHADFWTGYCYLEGLETERALGIFTRLATLCQERKYRWLAMKTLQRIASVSYNQKQYSLAIGYARQAADVAAELGDEIGIFDAQDQLTELYRSINNYPAALDSIANSQSHVNCCAFNPIKLWRHYAITALAFHSAGLSGAAIDTQREAVQRATATGETSMISLSYAHLGLMYGKAGNFVEGLRNTDFAYETAAKRPNEPRVKEMMAYSVLQSAHLYREQGRCGDALKSYDLAIDMYTSLKFPALLYQAYKGRLTCYITQNRSDLASPELDKVLDLVEKNRSTIFEGESRYRFFDVEQTVYDLGISFSYEQLADIDKAFELSEASRARSLLDLTLRNRTRKAISNRDERERSVSRPLGLSEIEQGLPSDSQIIAYSVLANRTLIWVLNSQGLRVRTSNTSEASLAEKVNNYLASIADSSSATGAAEGVELFAALIAPVADLLDRSKQLVIIPDKSLNRVPFSALRSSTDRYLIQDYRITYAPSVSVFIVKSKQSQGLNFSRPERVLSVGNPAFDTRIFPALSDLPAAQTEAMEIAGFYSGARLLLGNSATKQAVMQSLPRTDVAHLALHAIEDEQVETNSKLILAKEPNAADDRSSTLQAYEIGDLSLPARLVVLSACQTGAGRYYRGEGTFSLARSFLVAGVPVVIASLWPVDSGATSDLMIKFHQYRTQNRYSSARALQQAQLDLINSTDTRAHHPYYWASFVIQGGYATF
jgi:CHAT domain-containing protein/TolA-binding protein